MKRDAMLLVDALRDPATTMALDADGWTALLAMARAEQLIGTLARRLSGLDLPKAVAGNIGRSPSQRRISTPLCSYGRPTAPAVLWPIIPAK